MFLHKYHDTIKNVKTDNKKIDSVVQNINKEGVALQEEVRAAKQLRTRICNYIITELMKPKTYYKRLLDMEDNVKMYVYGFRDISTKCRKRYLIAVSPDNKLTTTTPLLLYPADRDLKDFINNRGGIEDPTSWDEWYKLDETNKICGRDNGIWCFIIEKHGTDYKKCKKLQPVIDVIEVFDSFREEDEGNDEVYENNTDVEGSIKYWKAYKDELFKHKYINSNKLQKINEIVKEGDVVEVLDCYSWKGIGCSTQV